MRIKIKKINKDTAFYYVFINSLFSSEMSKDPHLKRFLCFAKRNMLRSTKFEPTPYGFVELEAFYTFRNGKKVANTHLPLQIPLQHIISVTFEEKRNKSLGFKIENL